MKRHLIVHLAGAGLRGGRANRGKIGRGRVKRRAYRCAPACAPWAFGRACLLASCGPERRAADACATSMALGLQPQIKRTDWRKTFRLQSQTSAHVISDETGSLR